MESGKSATGIKAENDFTHPGSCITQLLPDDLFHEDGIGAQAFEISLLLLETRPGRRELRRAGRLILLELVVLGPRFEEKRPRTRSESGQQDDIKQDDEAARVHSSWRTMNIIAGMS